MPIKNVEEVTCQCGLKFANYDEFNSHQITTYTQEWANLGKDRSSWKDTHKIVSGKIVYQEFTKCH